MTTRLILPDEEIFSDYGPRVKWKNLPLMRDGSDDGHDSSNAGENQSSVTDDNSSDDDDTWLSGSTPDIGDQHQDSNDTDADVESPSDSP